MNTRYCIDAESIDPNGQNDNILSVDLQKKDHIEHFSRLTDDTKIFGIEGEGSKFWTHIKTELDNLIAPLKSSIGFRNFGLFAIINTIVSFFFKLNEPLVRGWRLNTVRHIALDKKSPVPTLRPDQLVKYYLQGLVLIVMRVIYFLPLLIIALLSGQKILNLVKELFFYFWDKFIGADTLSFAALLSQKIIPQAGIEILIQIVVLGFYTIFIWPIYRLIMIQYALKLTGPMGFLNPAVIKRTIGIFKKHAKDVYGIYGFTVAVDVFIVWLARFIRIFTFGLGFLIMPTFYLTLRHWVKGYSYGLLGKKLIESGAISVNKYSDETIIDENLV